MVFWAALWTPFLALWLWWPLRQWGLRALVTAVLLSVVAGVLPVGLIMVSRVPGVPYGLISHLQVISGALLAALLLCLVGGVLRDVLAAGLLVGRQRPAARQLRAPRTTLAWGGLSVLVAAYGAWQGVQVPQVQERQVTLARLPAALDGLRVTVLADLHATPVNNARYIQAVVERANTTDADLVVLPGDMVDGDARSQAGNIAPLAALQARYGVWAAPGNHEYYNGYDAWAQVYEGLGLHYLQNQTQVLDIRGVRVAISGLGDPAYGRLSQQNSDPHTPEGVPPDIAAVAAQAAAGQAQLHLLLAHQPKPARSYAPYGVDLHIAGHTHGGHILGLDQWVVAPANNGFVRGLYDVGSMRLFVSSGAGLWPGFTVRLGVPPAIDVLVLRSPQS